MFGVDPLVACNPAQPLHYVINVDTVKVENLTAREYCGDDLVLFGGCEDEDGM